MKKVFGKQNSEEKKNLFEDLKQSVNQVLFT